MKVIIQRVTRASVTVENEIIGKIENGFLILLGIGSGDSQAEARLLAKKTAELRIFCDENDKMNLSLLDVQGSALVISNFTLYADCTHGRRPSFTSAASPAIANELYELYIAMLKELGIENVQAGSFGADMKVELLNDGPVTIILDTKELM